jgi:hypothetical protein
VQGSRCAQSLIASFRVSGSVDAILGQQDAINGWRRILAAAAAAAGTPTPFLQGKCQPASQQASHPAPHSLVVDRLKAQLCHVLHHAALAEVRVIYTQC